jgi:hypothetical protein
MFPITYIAISMPKPGDGQGNRKVMSLRAAWKEARVSFRRQEKGGEDVECWDEYKRIQDRDVALLQHNTIALQQCNRVVSKVKRFL